MPSSSRRTTRRSGTRSRSTSTRRSRTSNSGYEANRGSSRSSRVRRAPGRYESQFEARVKEILEETPENINVLFDRRRIDASHPKARQSLTLLEIAADNGYASAVKMLLNRGASIENNKPLEYACRGRFADVVDILLKAGMNPNVDTTRHTAPLDTAVEAKCILCAKSMLKYGADITKSDNNYQSSLHTAVISEYAPMVSLLIKEGADVNEDLSNLQPSALFVACEVTDSLEVVRILLDAGADPNVTNTPYKMTPLHVAAQEGKATFVRALLKAGADPNAKAKAEGKHTGLRRPKMREDLTPLHFAAEENHPDVIDILVKEGHATIDVVDNNEITPLFLACTSGSLESAKRLLQLGANIDAGGKYSLHSLYKEGLLKPAIRELVEYYLKHYYSRYRRRHALLARGTRRANTRNRLSAAITRHSRRFTTSED